jgi:hypothetical protein
MTSKDIKSAKVSFLDLDIRNTMDLNNAIKAIDRKVKGGWMQKGQAFKFDSVKDARIAFQVLMNDDYDMNEVIKESIKNENIMKSYLQQLVESEKSAYSIVEGVILEGRTELVSVPKGYSSSDVSDLKKSISKWKPKLVMMPGGLSAYRVSVKDDTDVKNLRKAVKGLKTDRETGLDD